MRVLYHIGGLAVKTEKWYNINIMKNPIKAILAALALATFAGCFTIDSATSQTTGDEHVIVSNWGYRLFNIIPVFCGNATDPARDDYGYVVFFRDDVTMDKVQARFVDYTNHRGKTPDNIVYHTYDSVLFDVPFTQIPVPIPYLFCYREIQISGVIR